MDQPPTVAFTAFADAWPRAIETEIGAALCAIGAGKDFDFFSLIFIKVRESKLFGQHIVFIIFLHGFLQSHCSIFCQ